VLADALTNPQRNLSEAYAYDELYRLIGTDRGHFETDGTFHQQSNYQDWTLDGMGNFAGFDEDSDQNGTVDLNQTRDVNAANEMTDISESQGQTAWVTPTYDDAGNMISMPKPGAETTRLFAVYE
jgi:hypothetical protein